MFFEIKSEREKGDIASYTMLREIVSLYQFPVHFSNIHISVKGKTCFTFCLK